MCTRQSRQGQCWSISLPLPTVAPWIEVPAFQAVIPARLRYVRSASNSNGPAEGDLHRFRYPDGLAIAVRDQGEPGALKNSSTAITWDGPGDRTKRLVRLNRWPPSWTSPFSGMETAGRDFALPWTLQPANPAAVDRRIPCDWRRKRLNERETVANHWVTWSRSGFLSSIPARSPIGSDVARISPSCSDEASCSQPPRAGGGDPG